MKIAIKENGYVIDGSVSKLLRCFEEGVETLLPDWEIDHFYYGQKTVISTLRKGLYFAEFNITVKSVRLTRYSLRKETLGLFTALTYNDASYCGLLNKIVDGVM